MAAAAAVVVVVVLAAAVVTETHITAEMHTFETSCLPWNNTF